MTRLRAMLLYTLLSLALLFAEPGYNLIGAWAILFGGTAGSLALAVDCLPEFYQKHLGGITYFNPDAVILCVGALLIWIAGGFIIFHCFISPRRIAFRIALVCLWIIASIFNSYWFVIRSV